MHVCRRQHVRRSSIPATPRGGEAAPCLPACRTCRHAQMRAAAVAPLRILGDAAGPGKPCCNSWFSSECSKLLRWPVPAALGRQEPPVAPRPTRTPRIPKRQAPSQRLGRCRPLLPAATATAGRRGCWPHWLPRRSPGVSRGCLLGCCWAAAPAAEPPPRWGRATARCPGCCDPSLPCLRLGPT